MARLFEMFVAEWTRARLPAPFQLRAQESVVLRGSGRVRFDLDLVLYEAAGGRARAVLDTKYKRPARPSSADVAQVVAYATAKRCSEAWLVYPEVPDDPLDVHVGNVRVRTVGFALDGDLDEAGTAFLSRVLPPLARVA